MFNHAVRFYGLKVNPAAIVGNMGKAEYKEMLFWTTEEYTKFANEMMDKPLSYYAFQMLYWCGIRVEETFDVMEHIYNITDMEKGIIEKTMK